jgi:hypothetical protein
MDTNEEPKAMVGKGIKFMRIRRITGYLVGSLERFNDAKRSEEVDRIKHLGLPSKTSVNH